MLEILAKALAHEGAGAGAGRSKLFALLAVRTTEGVTDKTMARWVEEEAFATHLGVGQLTAEAARELASITAQGGRLPHDVLDCAPRPAPRCARAPRPGRPASRLGAAPAAATAPPHRTVRRPCALQTSSSTARAPL